MDFSNEKIFIYFGLGWARLINIKAKNSEQVWIWWSCEVRAFLKWKWGQCKLFKRTLKFNCNYSWTRQICQVLWFEYIFIITLSKRNVWDTFEFVKYLAFILIVSIYYFINQ